MNDLSGSLPTDFDNPFPGIAVLERRIGRAIVHRLGGNESPQPHIFPTLPANTLSDLCRLYPDPSALDLRSSLAHQCGAAVNELVLDAGADSLILLFLRTCCQSGDTVVATQGTYPTFKYFAQGLGLRMVEPPYVKHTHAISVPLAAMVEAAHKHRARLVYLANPDNPTGGMLSWSEIVQALRDLPADAVLMLDEAYVDFSAEPVPSGVQHRMIRLRSLSKGHGLAGLRIGFAIAESSWIDAANRLRIHYAVSGVAQWLAYQVVSNPDQQRHLIGNIMTLRASLATALRERGLLALESSTNFVTIRYGARLHAARIQEALWNQGVSVHRPTHPALDDLLRVTAHPMALSPQVLDLLGMPC